MQAGYVSLFSSYLCSSHCYHHYYVAYHLLQEKGHCDLDKWNIS